MYFIDVAGIALQNQNKIGFDVTSWGPANKPRFLDILFSLRTSGDGEGLTGNPFHCFFKP